MNEASSEVGAPATSRRAFLTVLVAALGYFVDIYDLILFLILRVKSLRALGVPANELLDQGLLLINVQMVGMFVGGILWGVLGDRRGRVSVLFGSILLYSIANIANGFVTNVPEYAVFRLLAGVGLAGELGAGITLVSEIMSREGRGWGTTIVAGVGLCGAIVAALVGGAFRWQVAYFVGGGLGLGLLVLRVGLYESGMFERARENGVERGNFFRLFTDATRVRRYVSVILVGLPIWFAIGILVGFSPELSKAMGLTHVPDPGRAVMVFYIGASIGDFGSGLLSQLLRSRKKVLGLFICLTAAAIIAYFTIGRTSQFDMYACCAALGAATGYWTIFVTVSAEQFGTNLRATATTTAPNFVRGSVVPMTSAFHALKASVGVVVSAMTVGGVSLLIAALALSSLEETFGKDLDFVEK